jgi:diguanylate cyclase (GGDEF)-like protein
MTQPGRFGMNSLKRGRGQVPDLAAGRRREAARERDRIAGERDRVAEELSKEAERLAEALGETDAPIAAALEAAAVSRAQAAADREHAARDRQAAARELELLQAELDRAQHDVLTGAYRRRLGEVALRNEVERAKRSGRPLVLAYIDVDGLKETNDRHGHAAGDRLLRDVASSLLFKLRPYDPLVRWGGDEFVCAISEIGLDEAGSRIAEVRKLLSRVRPGASISVGLAMLDPSDTLETLMSRADEELLEAKSTVPA